MDTLRGPTRRSFEGDEVVQLGASRRLAVAAALAFSAVTLSMPSSEGSTTQHGTALTGSVTRVGGVVGQDTVWEAGEYSASSEVQVPAGATLTLRPGVQFRTSAPTAFSVAGTLRIEGTEASPVRAYSPGYRGNLLVKAVGADARAFVDHLDAAGFPGIVDGGEPAAFSLTNSRVWADPGMANNSAGQLPSGSVVTGNEFVNADTLNLRTNGPVDTVVEDNRLGSLRMQGSGHVSLRGNTFVPGPGLALSAMGVLGVANSPVVIWNAEANYWGASNASDIAARIDDNIDSSVNLARVDFEPFLSAAPPATFFTPLPPEDVTAVRGSTSATVSWSVPVSDGGLPISSYTVRAEPGGQQITLADSARQTTFVGLTDGVLYTFSVTASNSRGGSLPSVSNAVMPLSAPAAPTHVKAVAELRRATVSWDAVPGAANYRVLTTPGGQWKTLLPSAAGQTVVTGLRNGTSYRFTVVAFNAAGSSAPSAASAPVTPFGHPGVVPKPKVVVKATGGRRAKVTLSWRAAFSNGARIRYYRIVGTKGVGILRVPAPRRSLVLTKLAFGKYVFRVSACNRAGCSPVSIPVRVQVPRAR
jgi:fibronectin type III domain protein